MTCVALCAAVHVCCARAAGTMATTTMRIIVIACCSMFVHTSNADVAGYLTTVWPWCSKSSRTSRMSLSIKFFARRDSLGKPLPLPGRSPVETHRSITYGGSRQLTALAPTSGVC